MKTFLFQSEIDRRINATIKVLIPFTEIILLSVFLVLVCQKNSNYYCLDENLSLITLISSTFVPIKASFLIDYR